MGCGTEAARAIISRKEPFLGGGLGVASSVGAAAEVAVVALGAGLADLAGEKELRISGRGRGMVAGDSGGGGGGDGDGMFC